MLLHGLAFVKLVAELLLDEADLFGERRDPVVELLTHLTQLLHFLRKSLLECNFMQALEGQFDSSHLGFLHSFVNAETNPTARRRALVAGKTPPPPVVKDGKARVMGIVGAAVVVAWGTLLARRQAAHGAAEEKKSGESNS